MANLYISEYTDVVRGSGNLPIMAGKEPAVARQKVAFTTAALSAAFNRSTILIRVYADADVWLEFGVNPTATVAKAPLPAYTAEYFGIQPGHKVSAYDGSS